MHTIARHAATTMARTIAALAAALVALALLSSSFGAGYCLGYWEAWRWFLSEDVLILQKTVEQHQNKPGR